MKNKLFIVISLIVAISCITGIVVSASADNVADKEITTAAPEIQRVAVNKDKTYYAYYNSKTQKGAVALCLDNQFTAYGESTKDIQLCTKNEDGTYTALHTVAKDNMTTWFAGKQEYAVSPSDNLSGLLGGLGSIGVTVDCEKTNLAFALVSQSIESGKTYYVYIPEDYYVDAEGVGNLGAYIEIESANVNTYTGDLCADLETITSGIYDIALFGIESLASVAR
ncbi:MAG: hypothetical protein IJW86_03135 [Clostridia bacterium]|nr:hypothetical protein [Clostridia bacterium]